MVKDVFPPKKKQVDTLAGTLLNALVQQGRGKVKVDGKYRALVCCPFHDDSTPSMSINFDPKSRYFGSFYCFGCGASGDWNKFAKQAYSAHGWTLQQVSMDWLKRLNALEQVESHVEPPHFDTVDDWVSYMYPTSLRWSALPTKRDWRGIDYETLLYLDTWVVQSFNPLTDSVELMPFFPCVVNGVPHGGVRVDLFNKLYLNTKNIVGNWRNTHGLLFHDAAIGCMQNYEHKFLCICEGVRDAMRLISLGVPAVAILGTNGWTPYKTAMVASMVSSSDSVGKVYFLMDSDSAGRRAAKMLGLEFDKMYVPWLDIRIPPTESGAKQDVFELAADLMDELLLILDRENGAFNF